MTERTIELEAGTFTAAPYRAEDERRVLDLWRVAFGKELDADLWRWKYVDNPFGMRVLVCRDPKTEAAVVVYSGVPYRARWNGREVEIVQLMDIMSHPDVRKTGLFIKAAEVFFDTFAGGQSVLYYGIPGRYHFDIGAKYLDYSELESGVAYLRGSTGELARTSELFGPSVHVIDRPTRELDRIWAEVAAHYPLAAVRDAAFVDWRFFRNPQRDYIVYVFRAGLTRRPRGYAVVGVDGKSARLVDILMPPDRAMIAAFSGRMAAELATREIETIETWLPGHHFMAGGLVEAGWSREPEPLGIVPTARSFDTRLAIPWVSKNFFYTMADSDLQ
ncbi:MAG: GNAT family N-acetyltransferase [Acidobacteriota bacterium]|nr:GNAT family N-acetyltransferase [Acidobacteriota bacterium]